MCRLACIIPLAAITLAAEPANARAQVKNQLMYTIGHLNGAPRIQPSDITLKRGIVGNRHPDFLWAPTRNPTRGTEPRWKPFRGGGLMMH